MVFVTAFAATSCQKDGEDMSLNDINQEPENGTITTGTAKATIDGKQVDVNWVQLWENGPKFAEYNVGATEVESYGGYYQWSSDCVSVQWGNNWRMPTKEEFDKLISSDYCTVTERKSVGIGKLIIFTGKGAYQSNNVSFPVAGGFNSNFGVYFAQGDYGYYWSSTPYGSSNAYELFIESGRRKMEYDSCDSGFSVRAVLNE